MCGARAGGWGRTEGGDVIHIHHRSCVIHGANSVLTMRMTRRASHGWGLDDGCEKRLNARVNEESIDYGCFKRARKKLTTRVYV